MIEGYILFCLSFAILAIIAIHVPALRLVDEYIYEHVSKEDKLSLQYKIFSGIIFFISSAITAPFTAFMYLLKPKIFIRGYSIGHIKGIFGEDEE